MPRFASTLGLLACLVPAVAPTVRGGPSAKPRTDFHGEPLPPGAVARCGGIRLHNLHYPSALAFAPGGKFVMAMGMMRGPVLCDVTSGRALRRMDGRSGWAQSPAFSGDGKILAAVSDQTVCLWDVGTGKQLRRLGNHLEAALTLALSPDGRLLAWQPYNNTEASLPISLWDVATGRKLKSLAGHGAMAYVLQFSPDGKTLTSLNEPYEYEEWKKGSVTEKITRSVAGCVTWWDVATGKRLAARKVDGPQTLGPDGRTAAVRTKGGRIEVRDLRADRLLHGLDTKDSQALFSRDGKVLVTSGKGAVISVWDVNTGRLRRRFPTRPPGHKDDPNDSFAVVALSPDGRILAFVDTTAGDILEHPYSFWDTASGRQLAPPGTHLDTVTCLAFTPDGKTLVSGSRDRTLRRWEAASGKPLGLLSGHGTTIMLAALSPDGTLLASGDTDNVLRLWDLSTGRARHTCSLPQTPLTLGFSPDGKRLEIVTDEGRVYLRDTHSGKPARSLRLRVNALQDVALYLHGTCRLDAAAGADSWLMRRLRLDPAQRAAESDLESGLFSRHLGSLAVSPDGRFLAVEEYQPSGHLGPPRYRIRVWEIATGKSILRLSHEWNSLTRDLCSFVEEFWYWGLPGEDTGSPARALVFSPDGRHLLAGYAYSRDIHVWDLATGEETKRLSGHEGEVRCLAFSPDGKTLASGSADSTVLVWDAAAALGPRRRGMRLNQQQLEREWAHLAGPDATRAYRAMWYLVGSPAGAVPLVRERLTALRPPKEARVRRLLADLDHEVFKVRANATAELEHLGDWAEPALRRALEKPPALEFRRRAEALLDKLAAGPHPASRLRLLRGIAVLERIGTPEARKALAELIRHAPGTALAAEAQAALDCITARH